jgi:hypothetical protein
MLKRSSRTVIVIFLLLAVSGCHHAFHQVPPAPSESVRNSVGMQLRVAEENNYPTLRIVLPGHPASDRAIEVIFPEHVTVTTAWQHRRKSDLPLSTRAIRRATAMATV